MTSETITQELKKAVIAFDKRFEETFHLKKHGYTESMVDFAKAAMSNLIGGIGYVALLRDLCNSSSDERAF